MGNVNCCCDSLQWDNYSQRSKLIVDQQEGNLEKATEVGCELVICPHGARSISNGHTTVSTFCGQYTQYQCDFKDSYLRKYNNVEREALPRAIRSLYREINGESVLETGFHFVENEVGSSEGREKFEIFTLLQIAALTKQAELVEQYLREGMMANQAISTFENGRYAGYSPLHLALSPLKNVNANQTLWTVYMVLHYGGYVNGKNLNGDTPLHVLLQTRSFDERIFKVLIRNGADASATNKDGASPFEVFISTGTTRDIKKYIKCGGSINHFNSTSKEGCISKMMIRGISIMAIMSNVLNLKQIDKFGRSVIHNTISFHTFDGTREQRKFFHQELHSLIKFFMNSEVNIDGQDSNGQTALHYAVRFQNCEVVVLLLNLGADINKKDNAKKTAMNLCSDLLKVARTSQEIQQNNVIMNILVKHLVRLQLTDAVVNYKGQDIVSKSRKIQAYTTTMEYTFGSDLSQV